jgi:hypothetical protein
VKFTHQGNAHSAVRAAADAFHELREAYYERLNHDRIRLTTLSAKLACAEESATAVFDEIRVFAHRLASAAAIFETADIGLAAGALERAAIDAGHCGADNAVAYGWGPLEHLANPGVEETHVFALDEREQILALLVRDDELHFEGERTGELEKMRLVQLVMTSEAGDRAKGRAAPNAELVRAVEQPLPDRAMMDVLPFAHIEPQE